MATMLNFPEQWKGLFCLGRLFRLSSVAFAVSVSVVSCAYPAGIAESQSRQGAELSAFLNGGQLSG